MVSLRRELPCFFPLLCNPKTISNQLTLSKCFLRQRRYNVRSKFLITTRIAQRRRGGYQTVLVSGMFHWSTLQYDSGNQREWSSTSSGFSCRIFNSCWLTAETEKRMKRITLCNRSVFLQVSIHLFVNSRCNEFVSLRISCLWCWSRSFCSVSLLSLWRVTVFIECSVDARVQIDVLLHQLGKVHFSCPIMHTIAPFSQIYQDFPFITSSYTPVIHGILPLSLADSSLFISSGLTLMYYLISSSIDTSLFPIKSTINLCDSSSIFLPVASTCLQEGLSSIQHSLSLSPPILLSCDNPYDRLPQLLVLLLFRNQHPSFSIEVCFDHLHTSWKSFSISLSSLSSWIDTSSLDFHTYRVTSNLSR